MDTVHVLAANLNRIIEFYKDRPHLGKPTSNATIGAKARISSNTVGRMRRGDGKATIGNIAAIAKVYGLTAAQMLVPGLDPASPPEIVADDAEKRLLAAFRDRGEEVRQPARH